MSNQAWCSLILLSLGCAGCGGGGPPLAKVSGKVTCQGQPVAKLVVHFVPQGAHESWGGTDNDGVYHLHYDRQRDGAVIGKHNVWVEVRPSNPKEDHALQAGTLKLHSALEQILAKYGNAQAPALSVEVREDNQVVDLALD